jgi:hypothetical protein
MKNINDINGLGVVVVKKDSIINTFIIPTRRNKIDLIQ